jgi:hypothetical protein
MNLVGDYIRNIASIAAPGARMILFMKSFRKGRPFGDPEVTRMNTDWTRRAFAGHFELERALPTFLAPDNSEDPLPGLVFWLSRTA